MNSEKKITIELKLDDYENYCITEALEIRYSQIEEALESDDIDENDKEQFEIQLKALDSIFEQLSKYDDAFND